MLDTRIFLPAVAMAGLTFVVWLRMYFARIGEMKRERIPPQAIATSPQITAVLKNTRAADNFRNLFELPVLFYLALTVAAFSGQVTTLVLILAWLFVGFRVLHSAIHCSYNKVIHRFYAYLGGGIVLWILWGVLGFGLVH